MKAQRDDTFAVTTVDSNSAEQNESEDDEDEEKDDDWDQPQAPQDAEMNHATIGEGRKKSKKKGAKSKNNFNNLPNFSMQSPSMNNLPPHMQNMQTFQQMFNMVQQ